MSEAEFRKSADKYVNIVEQNQLLNQISAIESLNGNVYPDDKQVMFFGQTGDAKYLTIFYNESGQLTEAFDSQILKRIEELKRAYTESTQPEQEEIDARTEQAQAEENNEEIQEILKDIDVELPAGKSQVLEDILKKAYAIYQNTQLLLGKPSVKYSEWINTPDGQAHRQAFNAIKKIWVADDMLVNPNKSLTQDQIKNDVGLLDWLRSEEGRNNDLVAQVLTKLNIPITNISGQNITLPEDGKNIEGNPNEDLVDGTRGINVSLKKQKWTDEFGKEGVGYIVIDSKTGQKVSAEILEAAGVILDAAGNFFVDIQKGIAARKAVEINMPSAGLFNFDGVEGLYQGATVYKKDKEYDDKLNRIEYVVWSTRENVINKNTIILIPATAVGLSTQEKKDQKVNIYLREGQFEVSYEVQELDFQRLPESVSRIEYTEPITPYGGKNENETNWDLAKLRYYAILGVLSNEDIKTLEFVVVKDPEGGRLEGNYTIPVSGKEPNPYIIRKRAKYQIGIRTNSSDVQDRINALFTKDGIQAYENADNIFAYMPNNNFNFFSTETSDGVVATEMSREELLQTIDVPKDLKNKLTKEGVINLVKENWAKQSLLVSEIDTLMKDVPEGAQLTITQEQLPNGISFNSILGNVVYDNSSTRNLKELVNEGAADESGNYLIYQLEAGNTERSKIIISNLKTDTKEKDALVKRVDEALKEQGISNDLINGKDAYMAAVLLPDGTYRLVPLKSEVLTSESLNEIFVKLVDRAQVTQEKNKNGEVPSFNNNFNDGIREELFISAHKGLSVFLNVDTYGRIQLTAVKDGVFTDFQLSKAEVNNKDLTVNQKLDLLITQANASDLFKNSVSSQGKKGLLLSTNNFRTSYGREVGIEELIAKTETNAQVQVAGVSKIQLGADSASIQAKRNSTEGVFQSTTPYGTPVGPIMTTSTESLQTSEEVERGILDLEQEEFDAYEVENFEKLPQEMLNHIANKLVRGEEALNEREQKVYNQRSSTIEFIVVTKGGLPVVEKTISPLEKLNQKLDALKVELVAGKKISEHRKILKDSKEYQAVLTEIKNYGNIANKISPALTSQDVEDINVFMAWAIENLPDFISIEDIATLGNNMKAGGVRVGAFGLNLNGLAGGLNISGTLYTGAKSPFRYHEAFHGVFRMLLTDVEIKKYLSIARTEVRARLRAEGKNFEQELQRFRNSADTYSEMSKARLEQEYYEEYLANEFEKFKENPRSTKTDSSVKSLFTRILEWIRSLFNSYHKNELLTLFENIDAGKYKTSAVTSNQFTNALTTGVTLEANALIPYQVVSDKESNNEGYLFLDSAVADPLVRSIAAMYLSRVSKITEPNTNRGEILDGVLNDFYELYHPDSEHNTDRPESQKEILNNITKAIENYLDPIQNQVYDILNVIDGQIAEEEYNTEYFEDTVGLRASDQWNTDASLIGGINSTPKQIRAYIATTTMSATDFFGNTELVSGEPLIIPVPFTEVYNGLLKSVKNISDPKKMLQTMYFFGQENAATGAVVTRILQDIGISEETLLNDSPLPNMKDPLLFQSITKAFENFRVDYIFTQRDVMGNILTYSAAQRDDINSQVDRWSQAWNDAQKKIKSDPKRKDTTLETLGNLISLLNETSSKSSVEAAENAKKYSELLFELTGIRLSNQYMLYSILYNRVQSGNVFVSTIENEDVTDTKQQALVDLHKYEETPLTSEVIREMFSIIRDGNDIFSDGKDGMNSRLVKIAKWNAPFDETIGLSVFKNSEGNLVYAHQKPTFHLKQIEALNNVSELETKKENPYLEENYLLNNPAFIQMSNEKRQRVIRVAGTSVGKINSTEEEINENISGVSNKSTYGNFTPQEFALSLINSYTALANPQSGKVGYVEVTDPITNEKSKVALTPSLLRVLEAANTGDMMYMPVIKAVEFAKGNSGAIKITDKVIDVFVTNINTEYKRIQRESNEDTKTNEEIVGYNAIGVDDKGEPLVMRAYELHNSSLLLTPAVKTQLEEIAKRSNSVSLEAAISELNMTMDELKSEVRNQLESQFAEFKTLLADLKIEGEISNKIKEGLIGKNIKSTPILVESNYLLNLTYDKDYNLKQIFFNDWVNTQAINEIILGDQAVTLKNMVDAVKRAKAQNAAYVSAYSAISAPALGVNHNSDDISLVAIEEPKGESALTGKNIDKADAQMWMTTKAFRYMTFGFGTLTPLQASLLDKIEQGEDITSWEIFGENGYVNQDGAMLNSKKLVYFDGTTYIKMSAFVLTPQLTSNKVVAEDGSISWVAKPNRVELHNLRLKLEGIESLPGKNTLGIAAPLTALKMLKQRVQTLQRLNEDAPLEEGDYTTLSAKNMGLQLVTPSNKLESVDPTQIKAIVTSEQIDETPIPGMGLNAKGTVMTVGDVRELYNEAISKRVEIKFKNKRNLIFTFDTAMDELAISKTKGKLTPNLMSFLSFAKEGLKASQASSQLLEFFSTENGEQKYDLNNPITANKFEELFFSYLSKGTLAEKQPGLSLALVSDFGMKVYRRVYSVDANGIPERSEIIREKVWDKMSNKPDIVEFDTLLRSEISKEGLVVLDRLRSNVKEYDSKGEFTGLRYTEMLMPAHFQSIIDLVENGTMSMPEAISKMFAIRIPSQDNHSTINVKHVDFLPAFYGSVAAFAQELIEISGADFDIDKVYAQIKEFYVKNGEFIEYGKANTDGTKYDEYLQYITEKVEKKGSIYNEAFNLYKPLNEEDGQSARMQNSVDDVEQEMVIDRGLSEKGLKALQMLGLPITVEQYNTYVEKHGEPYEAPMNNEILDYKYALMGNTAVTEDVVGNELPISYQSASLNVLEETLKTLMDMSEEGNPNIFAIRNQEDSVDINNLAGKIKAFANNKGAAIGAIVSPNVNLSLLTEYGIKLRDQGITINGIPYNDFGVLREKLSNGALGVRKQDIISSLITMATDDAKERLVAKLGLNRSALSLVGNLTALGVPIKTSLLLINNPVIQEIYTEALNKKEKTDPGVKKLVEAKMQSLKNAADIMVEVTDDLLYAAIINPEDVSDSELYSILNQFLTGVYIQDFTGKMKSVSNLTTGLGKNIAALNKKKADIDALLDPKAMMDLSKIYKSNTWQSKYIEILNQVVDQILPVTFLSASASFQIVLNKTLENINVSNIEFNDDALAAVSRDLLSYVTIKAYQHNKLKPENNSQSVANLNNNFIYPVSENEANNSIVKLIEKLRAREDMQDNFFLKSFVQLSTADDLGNQTGMNLAEANTFLSMNPLQKVDLQTSFAQIYGTATTKNDALSIIDYMMVKDGLQLKYGSLLDAISPFVLGAYLSQIETANLALRDGSDEKMKSAFGLTFDEFQKEFVDGYMQSNVKNALLITFIKSADPTVIPDKRLKIDRNNKSATVQWDDLETKPDYFRIMFDDLIQTPIYKTYKRTDTDEQEGYDNYVEVPTYGSNQQSGIGFMFGPRPTYSQIRSYVRNKNLPTNVSEPNKNTTLAESSEDQKKTIQENALQNENANIKATNGEVIIDGENIADIVETTTDNSASAAGLIGLLGVQPAQPTSEVVYEGFEIINKEFTTEDSLFPTANNKQLGEGMRDLYDSGVPINLSIAKVDSENISLGSPIQDADVDMVSFGLSVSGNNIGSLVVNFKTNEIINVEILPEFRGLGLGTKLYKAAAIELDGLTSDPSFLSTKAENIWKSLVKQGLAVKTNVKAKGTNAGYTMIDSVDLVAQQTSKVESELSETEESVIQIDAQLRLALFDALADQNNFLTSYWDNEIQGNKEFKAKLREQKILSLEDFIAARKEGIYKSDEDFLESLGCL